MTFPLRISTMAFLLLASSAQAALPGDAAEGKRLHDSMCMECHDVGVYTRKDRKMRSLDAVKGQLQNCSHMTKQEVTSAQAQHLLKYLNEQFYRFPQ
ncbi:MAG TPA: hypothetical protein PLX20_11885 [Rhodocyclaceae bacterium]|nr:hypothetical protein [Rhodocyclaceae bacterium]HMZ29124.1 hypothetical protein [Thauera aminoaromatica]HNA04501.1 hypothetical protein [Rhodocyclaceae bacterium]HNB79594.1 hypothetical protein [Rhodocyclaceae bacterium]HNC62886.1 hypothetical protein [Rhodocyclaceae bacterium]